RPWASTSRSWSSSRPSLVSAAPRPKRGYGPKGGIVSQKGSIMSDESFWTRRLSRRSALRVAAAGGLGAASLAVLNCGGSDDSSKSSSSSSSSSAGGNSQPTDKSGLLIKPTNTSAQAKRGGVFQDMLTNHATWDPNLNPYGGHI